MIKAILNNDIEMAELLFENGYKNCNPQLKRDASLPSMAMRLGLPEYLALHEKYCNSQHDQK